MEKKRRGGGGGEERKIEIVHSEREATRGHKAATGGNQPPLLSKPDAGTS